VLLRLLATFRGISRSLARLTLAHERLLKLELIRSDLNIDALDSATYAPPEPGDYTDLHQTDEEFARLEELKLDAERKGGRPSLFADLERDLEQEEKWP
jgi:hypothetical protein